MSVARKIMKDMIESARRKYRKSAFRIGMKNVKINTAVLICTAFLFRIVFFNIFVGPSFNARESNGLFKSHSSTVMKRRVNFDADHSENFGYSFAELREEEGTNDDNPFETSPFFLQVLYSLITDKIASRLNGIVSFYNYLSYSSSHRYLVFEVFRT